MMGSGITEGIWNQAVSFLRDQGLEFFGCKNGDHFKGSRGARFEQTSFFSWEKDN